MGNSKFWYYPSSTSNRAIEVDLGAKLSDRKGPSVSFRQRISESMSGAVHTITLGGRPRIRVEHTFQTTGANTTAGRILRRELWNLINHLQRGGVCLFAEDSSKFYVTRFSTPPMSRDSVMHVERNIFREIVGGTVTLTGEEIVIFSDYSAYVSEMHRVTAQTSGVSFTVADGSTNGIINDYNGFEWTMARELGSYPAMRIPPDQRNGEFLTHDGENTFFLDLPLEDDPAATAALATTGDAPTTTEGPQHVPGQGGPIGLPDSATAPGSATDIYVPPWW